MKISIFTVLLVLSCSLAFSLEYQISGGIDITNRMNLGNYMGNPAMVAGIKYRPGASVSAELISSKANVFFGSGAEYQFERKHAEMGEGWTSSIEAISFLPVYAMLGYRFPVSKGPVPELFVHLGHSFSLIEDSEVQSTYDVTKARLDGGFYHAFGFGLEYQNVVLQTLLRYNDVRIYLTEIENNGDTEKSSNHYSCHQLGFRLGYRF
jgi:hypothetical protein